MGKPDPSGQRLLKIVLPTTSHWREALANTHLLRKVSDFKGVYIRRSMAANERKRDCEMRQMAKNKNTSMGRREWCVYSNELQARFFEIA